MPELPNIHILFVLVLTTVALALFATDRLRLDNAALLVFVVLLVGFAAAPYSLEDGGTYDPIRLLEPFGNEALVAVCALMVLGKGIETTRALQPLITYVSRQWGPQPRLTMLVIMVVAAVLSAFMNNTPIVVLMLPALIAVARQNDVAPSRLLLPIGLVTIIGGMSTTIGTSTNLLIAALSKQVAGVRFEMFDFSWYVLIAGSAGIVYLWLAGPKLSPQRADRPERAPGREYLATLRIREGSSTDGETVAEFLKSCKHSLAIDRIQRDGSVVPLPTVTLRAGDVVYVRGSREALKEAEHKLEVSLTDPETDEYRRLANEPQLAELVIGRHSELRGKTLREARTPDRFGITIVALHRPDPRRRRSRSLLDIELREGDILLCEATEPQLGEAIAKTDLLRLHGSSELPPTSRSWVALAITAAVVIVAAVGLLPIAISALAGVGLMLMSRCLAWRHVRDALSTNVILVIVVSLALGQAMIVTGGADYLAQVFSHLFADASAFVVILAIMLAAAILTNVVTNNAAAVIVTPIAVEIAAQLGIDTRAVVLAVLFGANLSFITPIGYQTNLLVFSAGNYRFTDFLKVGGPLLIGMLLIFAWLIRIRFGL
jgi:di/tricarboxylate transporter